MKDIPRHILIFYSLPPLWFYPEMFALPTPGNDKADLLYYIQLNVYEMNNNNW